MFQARSGGGVIRGQDQELSNKACSGGGAIRGQDQELSKKACTGGDAIQGQDQELSTEDDVAENMLNFLTRRSEPESSSPSTFGDVFDSSSETTTPEYSESPSKHQYQVQYEKMFENSGA